MHNFSSESGFEGHLSLGSLRKSLQLQNKLVLSEIVIFYGKFGLEFGNYQRSVKNFKTKLSFFRDHEILGLESDILVVTSEVILIDMNLFAQEILNGD